MTKNVVCYATYKENFNYGTTFIYLSLHVMSATFKERLRDRMKSLNGKRIAAVAAGAALLGLGLAFAGPVSFQNVPIISNSGQPVVQVVIGSTAKPSDGAAAANIAAAIGNLAYTSVPVTATVNMTQAAKVLLRQTSRLQ
jgi:hypothetical protein